MDINNYIKEANINGYVLTKFLDTTESSNLLKSRIDKKIYIFGGFENAERVRAIVQNKEYVDPTNDDFEIALLKVELTNKEATVKHQNVLGTLMSLGIKREVVGDIVINQNIIYIFITKDMINFIKSNLININHYSLIIQETTLQEFIPIDNSRIENINIASRRLDVVVSEILKKSRSEAVKIIEKGDVLVNHIEQYNNSYMVKDADLLSIRHFGRVEIIEDVKITRKNRLVLMIKVTN